MLLTTPSSTTLSPVSVIWPAVSIWPLLRASVSVPVCEVALTRVRPGLSTPMRLSMTTSFTPLSRMRPLLPVELKLLLAQVRRLVWPGSTLLPALMRMSRVALILPLTSRLSRALMTTSALAPAAIRLPSRVLLPAGFNTMLPLRVSMTPSTPSSRSLAALLATEPAFRLTAVCPTTQLSILILPPATPALPRLTTEPWRLASIAYSRAAATRGTWASCVKPRRAAPTEPAASTANSRSLVNISRPLVSSTPRMAALIF